MKFILLLLAGLLAQPAAAQPQEGVSQTTLSGTVRDSLTQQPLPFASVFLANTTRGATTDGQGRYALPGVPAGRYELAATYLGYQLRQRPITIAQASLVADISLPASAHTLAEVVVRPNPHREADYQRFLELFLGASTHAKQCRVRNPDAVLVDYDGQKRELTATVPHKLEVDNLALGYRVTFYDLDFRADFGAGTISTLAHQAFQELPGSAAKQRRWAEARRAAYQGSLAHFLQAVRTNTVAEAGFEVRKLRRVPNRRYARADSIRRAIYRAGGRGQAAVPDSIWRQLKEPPVYAYLFRPLLPPDSLRRTSGNRMWLRFHDLLAIDYPRARPDANYQAPGQSLEALRVQASVLHLNNVAEAELDARGNPLSPLDVLTEGYWGFEQMGDLLPLDYRPEPEIRGK
ncbi:MAG: carboxypeptidase-like regulatory domain-containing protein [Janthinobacterium lividum]